jgi:hypothetical protein
MLVLFPLSPNEVAAIMKLAIRVFISLPINCLPEFFLVGSRPPYAALDYLSHKVVIVALADIISEVVLPNEGFQSPVLRV